MALSTYLPDEAYHGVLPMSISAFVTSVFKSFSIGNSSTVKTALWLATLTEVTRAKFTDYLGLLVRRRSLEVEPEKLTLQDVLMFWSMRYLASMEAQEDGEVDPLWVQRGAIKREFLCKQDGNFKKTSSFHSKISVDSMYSSGGSQRYPRFSSRPRLTRDELEKHAEFFIPGAMSDSDDTLGEWQHHVIEEIQKGTLTLRGLLVPISLQDEVSVRLRQFSIEKRGGTNRNSKMRNWTKVADARSIRVTNLLRKNHRLKGDSLKSIQKRNPNYKPVPNQFEDLRATLTLLMSGRSTEYDFDQAQRIRKRARTDVLSKAFTERVWKIRNHPKVKRALARWWHQFGYKFTKSQLESAKTLFHAAGSQTAIFLLKASTRQALAHMHATSHILPQSDEASDAPPEDPCSLNNRGNSVENRRGNGEVFSRDEGVGGTFKVKGYQPVGTAPSREKAQVNRSGSRQARKLASLERQIERLRVQCGDDENISFETVPAFERIPFDLYLEIDRKIFSALVGANAPTLMRRSSIIDFYHDSCCERQEKSVIRGSSPTLDVEWHAAQSLADPQWVSKDTWLDSLFCMADMWTNTSNPIEYCAFLDNTLLLVTDHIFQEVARQNQQCRRLVYSGRHSTNNQGNQEVEADSTKSLRWPENLGDPNRRPQAWSLGPSQPAFRPAGGTGVNTQLTSKMTEERTSPAAPCGNSSDFYLTKIAYESKVEGNNLLPGKESRSCQAGYLGCGVKRIAGSLSFRKTVGRSSKELLGVASRREKLPRWMQDKAFESLAVNSNVAVGVSADNRRDVTKQLVSQEIFTKYLSQIVMDDHNRKVSVLKRQLTQGTKRGYATGGTLTKADSRSCIEGNDGNKIQGKTRSYAPLKRKNSSIKDQDRIRSELEEHMKFIEDFCARRAAVDSLKPMNEVEGNAKDTAPCQKNVDEISKEEQMAQDENSSTSCGERVVWHPVYHQRNPPAGLAARPNTANARLRGAAFSHLSGFHTNRRPSTAKHSRSVLRNGYDELFTVNQSSRLNKALRKKSLEKMRRKSDVYLEEMRKQLQRGPKDKKTGQNALLTIRPKSARPKLERSYPRRTKTSLEEIIAVRLAKKLDVTTRK